MKKFLKYFAIILTSLTLVVVFAVGVGLWLVFTPERLTPIVRTQAQKFINCHSDIGNVELTFFSTFPKFGLKADRLILVNPVDGATCDTLIKVDKIIGIINISSLVKNKELIVNEFRLLNGKINAFIDNSGNANFYILKTDTIQQTDTLKTDMLFKVIDINNVEFENIDIFFLDLSNNMKAEMRHLTATVSGSMETENLTAKLNVKPFDISMEYQNDSLTMKTEIHNLSAKIDGTMKEGVIETKAIINPFDIFLNYNSANAKINELSLNIKCTTDLDNFSGDMNIKPFRITFVNDNEEYLQNAEIQLNVIADASLSRRWLNLKETSLSLNDFKIDLLGTIENNVIDNDSEKWITNLSYKFNSWSIKDIIELIPKSFASYLDGIDISGKLSSEGLIEGVYDEASFPMADVNLKLEKGTLNYADFPLPLREINGELNIHTDLKNPKSYIRINGFSAKTPQSSIKITGLLNNLFADIRADLNSEMVLSLPEFTPFIPDSMNIEAKGELSGKFNTVFTMSQITNKKAEKIELTGNAVLSNFAVNYDSIAVKTDRAIIDIALPNNRPNANGVVYAGINANSIDANKLNSLDFSLVNAEISVELSELKMSDMVCFFKMEDLKANTDFINIHIAKPSGIVYLVNENKSSNYPAIGLAYKSERIQADFDENKAEVEKLAFNLSLMNDTTKQDLVSQWSPQGFIDLQQGVFSLAAMAFPLKLPAVKMNFNPESFAIENLNVILDKSDFNLSGRLDNISSWFRKDSLLCGNFKLASEMTDINQIMNLTNGIGHSETEKEEISGNSSSTYLVPKGITMSLETNIKKAIYNKNITADNIRGKIQVHNGTLILDQLALVAPATNMELTALYRTPRKNHLFFGFKIALLNIEIPELLSMIPAVDSIMPMLRSFNGRGEFHLAGETYLDSMYNVKMSTLRAASSIRGNDLVLMDGQTFSEIAKTLNFSKKTENKVDSISAEFTVFKNEIDVYPFLIVMDKYKAVVGGRHNLDNSFDYNISLVQSPLPIRLAVDVRGTPDKMRYLPAKSKYPDFYRPSSRKEIESKDLELRNLIRSALMSD